MDEDCCTQCFNDAVIRRLIEERGVKGDCPRCSASQVMTISSGELSELFEPVLQLYAISAIGYDRLPEDDPWDHGTSLLECLQDDWQVFSDSLDEDKANDLLDDIVNWHRRLEHPRDRQEIDINDVWVRTTESFTYASPEEYWERFKLHLQRERRFIPDETQSDIITPRDLLTQFLEQTALTLPAGMQWYRCREKHEGTNENPLPLPPSQMGPPPPERSIAGRANPEGIPFLYLSSNIETAVAEKRAWRSQIVSVATFVLKQEVQVANLAIVPYMVSPFGLSDMTSLGWEVEKVSIIRHLAEELSRPVNPRAGNLEYLATQYLTGLIRSMGYGGVQFKSAMGEGTNLALFDVCSAQPVSTLLIKVAAVKYTLKEMGKPRTE